MRDGFALATTRSSSRPSGPDAILTPHRPFPTPQHRARAAPARYPSASIQSTLIFIIIKFCSTQNLLPTLISNGDVARRQGPAVQPVEDPPVVIRVPFLCSGGGMSDLRRSGRCGEHGGRLLPPRKNSRYLTESWIDHGNPRFPRGDLRAPGSQRAVRGSPKLRGEVRGAIFPSPSTSMSILYSTKFFCYFGPHA